ncbi:MAG: hypothetical protein U0835_26460 [Isosphaeraceae bacterium]
MTSYLTRYMEGEHEAVWSELSCLGERVRNDEFIVDALAVARETMRRVRSNVERLVQRLDQIGYEFSASRLEKFDYKRRVNPFTKQIMDSKPRAFRRPMVFCPPGPETAALVDRIEMAVGGLPLSLRAWLEIVGEVDLRGSHPGWPGRHNQAIYPDPLVMVSAEKFFTWLKEEIQYKEQYSLDPQQWSYDVPDYYTKEKISGGGYWIELPDLAADATFNGDWDTQVRRSPAVSERSFMRYLRTCFRWGGFPGFAVSKVRPDSDLTTLAADLMPF